jgi:ABC-type branched-subunit amino acid transport system substrate-binding protein
LTRRKLLVLTAVLSLVLTACGSRLNSQQLSIAEGANSNNGNGGRGSSGGSTAGGGPGSVAAGSGTTATTLGSGRGGAGSTGSGGSAGRSGPTGSGGGSSGGAGGGSGGSGGGGVSGGTLAAGSEWGVAPSGVAISPSVCKGPAGGPGVSSSAVNLGAVITITGPIPGLEIGALHGINAFVTYLNSIGGICGRKVVLKTADDNLDASQNATATQSLMGSVMGFVGSLSGDDQGGASVLQANPSVPDVSEALSVQAFNLPNNFSPSPVPLGLNLAPYVYFKQKYPNAVTHMAVLAENQSTALTDTKAQVQALESIGYKFVYTDYNIEPTQSDFSTDADEMKAHGAEGLYFLAIGSFYAEVAKAVQDAGLHLTLPNYSENAYDPTFLSEAGSAANGSILDSYLAMYGGEDSGSNPMVALLNKWYRALYGSAADEFAAWGWMDGLLFVEGLNAGGGLTRANLLNGLHQVTSFTAGGLQSPASPVRKKPPNCYLVIDVVNQHFVRDPADPGTGFDCQNAPDWYYAKG